MKEKIENCLCAIFTSVACGGIGALLTFALALELDLFSEADCTLTFIFSILGSAFVISALFGLCFYIKVQKKMLATTKNDN